jgi:hypothetical protein
MAYALRPEVVIHLVPEKLSLQTSVHSASSIQSSEDSILF